MLRIRAQLSGGLALSLALLCALGPATIASAATPATGRGTTPAPTFTVPASERVHGATTAPASTIPVVPASPARAATPGGAGARTTPTAGAETPAAGATTPAAGAPAATVPVTPAGAPASTTPATTLPAKPAGAGVAAVPATAAGHRRGSSAGLSTGAIVAAALAALLIVVCLAWGVARWFAYEPRWSVSLRHSLAEAGWRLSASWDEFSDWARIGR